MYQVGGLAIIKIMNNGTAALCTAELLFPGGLLGFTIFVLLNCYFHVDAWFCCLCTAELLFPCSLLGFALFVLLNCYFHVACLVLLSLYC